MAQLDVYRNPRGDDEEGFRICSMSNRNFWLI